MYRRLFLPFAVALAAGLGANPYERAAVRMALESRPRIRINRAAVPRAPGSRGAKHAPQKPSRKNCQHRKHARARRRAARLRGRKG